MFKRVSFIHQLNYYFSPVRFTVNGKAFIICLSTIVNKFVTCI